MICLSSETTNVQHRLPDSLPMVLTYPVNRACVGCPGCWIRAQALCKAISPLGKVHGKVCCFWLRSEDPDAVHCICRSGRSMETMHGEEMYRGVEKERDAANREDWICTNAQSYFCDIIGEIL